MWRFVLHRTYKKKCPKIIFDWFYAHGVINNNNFPCFSAIFIQKQQRQEPQVHTHTWHKIIISFPGLLSFHREKLTWNTHKITPFISLFTGKLNLPFLGNTKIEPYNKLRSLAYPLNSQLGYDDETKKKPPIETKSTHIHMTHGVFARLIIDLKFINFYCESSCDIRIEFIIIILCVCVCCSGSLLSAIFLGSVEQTQWQPVDLWLSAGTLSIYNGFVCPFFSWKPVAIENIERWIAQSEKINIDWVVLWMLSSFHGGIQSNSTATALVSRLFIKRCFRRIVAIPHGHREKSHCIPLVSTIFIFNYPKNVALFSAN